MLDNRYAILFIRGELPVMDLKYDILKHPAVDLTAEDVYKRQAAKGAAPKMHIHDTVSVPTYGLSRK